MAGSTLATVKRAWVDILAALPAMSEWQVTYGWPGDGNLTDRCLWIGGASTSSETTALRAGRRRRTETVLLTVGIWAAVETSNPDVDAREQADVDALAALQAIDEHIADEEHLGLPALVENAWLDGWTAEHGPTAGGGWSTLLTVTVRYTARLL